ncbi:RagB/SusD family nutrient uptake outer membrane protein [Sphingobacterium corticibacterium]|nr:RagB/SusD family nutrient uptake outer membrane protein [Sphingobacterium corticibacterium]
MMKKSIIKLGLLAALLSFQTACNTSLELDPTSVITNESFWKTEDDARGGLTSLYVKQRSLASLNLFIWGEARSEVMEWGKVSGTLDYDRYYLNTLSSVSAGPSWQAVYSAINDANLILKYVPNISFANEANKNDLLAQAYVSRAFLYFVLVKTWGEVPIRTEPVEGAEPDVIQKARSSQEQVFTLIKDDLEKANALFSSYSFIKSRNYWSKAGVQALKADVYLWTAKRLSGGNADFQTALTACDEVAKADVSLLPNYADLFEYGNKNNNEVIMAIGNKEFEIGNNYFANLYSSRLPNEIDPTTNEIIGQTSGGMVWTVTDLAKNQFKDGDLRKAASVLDMPAPGFYPTLIIKGRGTLISGVRYFTSDFVIYRYADVLLMKAEAKNGLGQDPSTEMNLVRQRAYGAAYEANKFVNGSNVQNDQAILQERLLELMFEGKRWWDLVRFHKAFELVPTLEGRANQKHLEYFPISEQVLSLEPLVEQTNGY